MASEHQGGYYDWISLLKAILLSSDTVFEARLQTQILSLYGIYPVTCSACPRLPGLGGLIWKRRSSQEQQVNTIPDLAKLSKLYGRPAPTSGYRGYLIVVLMWRTLSKDLQ